MKTILLISPPLIARWDDPRSFGLVSSPPTQSEMPRLLKSALEHLGYLVMQPKWNCDRRRLIANYDNLCGSKIDAILLEINYASIDYAPIDLMGKHPLIAYIPDLFPTTPWLVEMLTFLSKYDALIATPIDGTGFWLKTFRPDLVKHSEVKTVYVPTIFQPIKFEEKSIDVVYSGTSKNGRLSETMRFLLKLADQHEAIRVFINSCMGSIKSSPLFPEDSFFFDLFVKSKFSIFSDAVLQFSHPILSPGFKLTLPVSLPGRLYYSISRCCVPIYVGRGSPLESFPECYRVDIPFLHAESNLDFKRLLLSICDGIPPYTTEQFQTTHDRFFSPEATIGKLIKEIGL